jgi:VIT1/CCC1 family predicted Fe2+/Mn2+ transporter
MAKKANKLTKDELEQVRKAVNSVRSLTNRIGDLEIAKSTMIGEYQKAQAQLAEERKILQEKYGDISIDIESGEYEEVVEEAETVEE